MLDRGNDQAGLAVVEPAAGHAPHRSGVEVAGRQDDATGGFGPHQQDAVAAELGRELGERRRPEGRLHHGVEQVCGDRGDGLGRGAVGVLVGVELDQVGNLGLLPGNVGHQRMDEVAPVLGHRREG